MYRVLKKHTEVHQVFRYKMHEKIALVFAVTHRRHPPYLTNASISSLQFSSSFKTNLINSHPNLNLNRLLMT